MWQGILSVSILNNISKDSETLTHNELFFTLHILCTRVSKIFMLFEFRIIILPCVSDYKRGSDWQLDLLNSYNS
jgi:hypothetical protein